MLQQTSKKITRLHIGAMTMTFVQALDDTGDITGLGRKMFVRENLVVVCDNVGPCPIARNRDLH